MRPSRARPSRPMPLMISRIGSDDGGASKAKPRLRTLRASVERRPASPARIGPPARRGAAAARRPRRRAGRTPGIEPSDHCDNTVPYGVAPAVAPGSEPASAPPGDPAYADSLSPSPRVRRRGPVAGHAVPGLVTRRRRAGPACRGLRHGRAASAVAVPYCRTALSDRDGAPPAGRHWAGLSRLRVRGTAARSTVVSLRLRQFESFRTSPIVPELPAPDLLIKRHPGPSWRGQLGKPAPETGCPADARPAAAVTGTRRLRKQPESR
eukprot:746216-Hanusia_phi.AAC.1